MSVQNSLVKQPTKKSFSSFLTQDDIKKRIFEIVGRDSQKFMTSILSAVTNNSTLQECEPMSILNCAFLGEGLKLSPSPQLGQYYMVPFNDSKRNIKVAQFQLGYRGYIQLAERSGYYRKINVLAIKEGELIKYDPLTEELEVNLIEDEELREETKTIGYYAMFEYMNGFRKTLYWSKKKMLLHADKYSQSFSLNAKKGKEPKYDKVSYEDYMTGKVSESEMWKYSSFWYKDFDGMAFKTMLRQLISKWGIMSIDMQEAYTKDMAEIKEDGSYEYIDNVQEENEDNKGNFIETTTIQEQQEDKTEVKTTKEKKPKKEVTNKTTDEFMGNEMQQTFADELDPLA